MNPRNSSPHPIRDFIGGLLLVITLHSLFLGLMVLIVAPTIGGSNQLASDIFLFLLVGVGLTQLLYLSPAILYFQRKRRSEVVKGLLLGALMTILLNGSCFFVTMPMVYDRPEVIGSAQLQVLSALLLSFVILLAIGYYCLKRRS